MSSSPVAPVNVAPASVAAAALRAEILGAAETELLAAIGSEPLVAPGAPTAKAAASPDPISRAVDSARTSAAARQGSLAPLFADLAEILATPSLPGEVKAAIAQVLAFQLPAKGPVAAQDLQQAVARSGL